MSPYQNYSTSSTVGEKFASSLFVFQVTTHAEHTSSSISVLLYSRWCRSITDELCSFASGDKLLQESTRTRVYKLYCWQCPLMSPENDPRQPPPQKILLRLVEIVGPSVVNIMTESSSNHSKGLQVGVILLQFTCLLRKRKDNAVF